MEEALAPFRVTSPDSEHTRYIGVQIPGETTSKLCSYPLVLHSFLPSKTIVSLPSAFRSTMRFKEFPTYEQACQFSKGELAVPVDENMKKVVEPRSPYPTPSNADKDAFLAALSTGNRHGVRKLLWKNPKLLVSPDDSSQYYRGTWRQTPLHMAVQSQNFPLFW